MYPLQGFELMARLKILEAEVSTEALYALALNLQLIGVPGLITSMWQLEYSFLFFLTVFVSL